MLVIRVTSKVYSKLLITRGSSINRFQRESNIQPSEQSLKVIYRNIVREIKNPIHSTSQTKTPYHPNPKQIKPNNKKDLKDSKNLFTSAKKEGIKCPFFHEENNRLVDPDRKFILFHDTATWGGGMFGHVLTCLGRKIPLLPFCLRRIPARQSLLIGSGVPVVILVMRQGRLLPLMGFRFLKRQGFVEARGKCGLWDQFSFFL